MTLKMEYPPKILINRQKTTVEFRCGGQIFIFKPGEKKLLDGFVAYHALNETKTGLEEFNEEIEQEELAKTNAVMPDFRGLKFQKLVSLAKGDFKPGMKHEDLVKLLEERWQKRHQEIISSNNTNP